MNNKELSLEHSSLMQYSKEIIQLKIPRETNVIFYTIICLFIICFCSLFFIKINDVVKVKGCIRTKINNSEIKNVIPGKITKINYTPNQFVNKGDILFELEDKEYCALLNVLNNNFENTKKEIECTKALLECIQTNKNNYKNDKYISSKIELYLKTVNYMNKQIKIYKYQYDCEKSLPESLKNLKTEKQAFYAYSLCCEELEKYKADFKSSNIEKYNSLVLKKDQIEQELIQVKQKYSNLKITAPISGFIQEISSLNVGDYIFENQNVLKIIPSNNNFKVELIIPTKNIGEITEGMEVKYRLSAFPFFEYKGANGKITTIDPDIRINDNNQLVYCVYSDLNKNTFKNYQGKEYPVRSGIDVDARIILEKITLISYIFRKMGYIK